MLTTRGSRAAKPLVEFNQGLFSLSAARLSQQGGAMYGSTRQLVERFKRNFRNPRLRRNVAIRMAGKLLGMGIVLVAITTIVPSIARAAAPGIDATSEINAINTM